MQEHWEQNMLDWIRLYNILICFSCVSIAQWEVCRDSKAVGTLRELIVLMRIWGLIRPACLPSFRKTTENLDVLPLLFRLLTKLSVTPHDPDESLIGEQKLLIQSQLCLLQASYYFEHKLYMHYTSISFLLCSYAHAHPALVYSSVG